MSLCLVFVFVHIHGHMRIEAKDGIGHLLWLCFLVFIEAGSLSRTQSLLIQASLGMQLALGDFLSLPSEHCRRVTTCAQHLHGFWRSKLLLSCLLNQCFPRWVIFPVLLDLPFFPALIWGVWTQPWAPSPWTLLIGELHPWPERAS